MSGVLPEQNFARVNRTNEDIIGFGDEEKHCKK